MAEIAMRSLPIVKALDVVEHISSGLVPGSISYPVYTLSFKQAKEALDGSVVVAVTTSTHATAYTMPPENVLIVIA